MMWYMELSMCKDDQGRIVMDVWSFNCVDSRVHFTLCKCLGYDGTTPMNTGYLKDTFQKNMHGMIIFEMIFVTYIFSRQTFNLIV